MKKYPLVHSTRILQVVPRKEVKWISDSISVVESKLTKCCTAKDPQGHLHTLTLKEWLQVAHIDTWLKQEKSFLLSVWSPKSLNSSWIIIKLLKVGVPHRILTKFWDSSKKNADLHRHQHRRGRGRNPPNRGCYRGRTGKQYLSGVSTFSKWT